MSGITWIEADDLIAFNQLLVADTGEPFQLRDIGLLESAVARPKMTAHYDGEEDVVVLACALASSIAQNHPFAQGNKRTAQGAMFRFLWINDYTFRDPDDLELAEAMLALLTHEISEAEYVSLIDSHVVDR